MSSGPHATDLTADGPTQMRVCAECFNDEAIRRFIRHHGASGTCDFCGAVGVPTAAWDETLTFIRQGLESVWSDEPDPLVPWDWENGPVPQSYSIEDLLEAVGAPIRSEPVIAEIVRARGCESWYNRITDGPVEYAQLDNWESFRHRIMHRSRFFFFRRMLGDPDDFDPPQWPSVEVLDELGKLIRESELVKPLLEGEGLFRARQHYPHEQPSPLTSWAHRQSRRHAPAG